MLAVLPIIVKAWELLPIVNAPTDIPAWLLGPAA